MTIELSDTEIFHNRLLQYLQAAGAKTYKEVAQGIECSDPQALRGVQSLIGENKVTKVGGRLYSITAKGKSSIINPCAEVEVNQDLLPRDPPASDVLESKLQYLKELLATEGLNEAIKDKAQGVVVKLTNVTFVDGDSMREAIDILTQTENAVKNSLEEDKAINEANEVSNREARIEALQKTVAKKAKSLLLFLESDASNEQKKVASDQFKELQNKVKSLILEVRSTPDTAVAGEGLVLEDSSSNEMEIDYKLPPECPEQGIELEICSLLAKCTTKQLAAVRKHCMFYKRELAEARKAAKEAAKAAKEAAKARTPLDLFQGDLVRFEVPNNVGVDIVFARVISTNAKTNTTLVMNIENGEMLTKSLVDPALTMKCRGVLGFENSKEEPINTESGEDSRDTDPAPDSDVDVEVVAVMSTEEVLVDA